MPKQHCDEGNPAAKNTNSHPFVRLTGRTRAGARASGCSLQRLRVAAPRHTKFAWGAPRFLVWIVGVFWPATSFFLFASASKSGAQAQAPIGWCPLKVALTPPPPKWGMGAIAPALGKTRTTNILKLCPRVARKFFEKGYVPARKKTISGGV